MVEPVEIWFSVYSGGDGSAYPRWFLTEEDAQLDQDTLEEGWGEPCIGQVQTYVGSRVHAAAVRNSDYIRKHGDMDWRHEE